MAAMFALPALLPSRHIGKVEMSGEQHAGVTSSTYITHAAQLPNTN